MFDEVENYARLLKVKAAMAAANVSLVAQAELEKVMHAMAEDYRDRTDECLPTLARKRL
jgi:hypothetical protein